MTLIVASILVFFSASILVDWRSGVPLFMAAIFNFAIFDVLTALSVVTDNVVLWYASIDIVTGIMLVLLAGRNFIIQTVLLILAAVTHMVLYVDVSLGSSFVYDDYEAVIYGITIAQMIFIWRGGLKHGFIDTHTYNSNSLVHLFSHYTDRSIGKNGA